MNSNSDQSTTIQNNKFSLCLLRQSMSVSIEIVRRDIFPPHRVEMCLSRQRLVYSDFSGVSVKGGT